MAVFGAIRFDNWSQLARDLQVSREHLVAVRGARAAGVGFKLAVRVEVTFGPRHQWILSAEGPIFYTRNHSEKHKRTYAIVESAIKSQLAQGLGPGEGLAVFDDLESVTPTPREIPIDELPAVIPENALGAIERLTEMNWLAFERRAAGLPGAGLSDAFYVRLDNTMREVSQARAGDYCLFAFTDWYLRRFAPVGDESLICLLEAKGRRRLARMVVQEILVSERGGVSPKMPKTTNTIVGRDEAGTRFVLRPATKMKLAAGEAVLAAAIKVERDIAGA